MEHTEWVRRPKLDRPVVIAAFEGWNDAGEAATVATRFLCDEWQLRPAATIDPEDFYDFTTTRPQVRITDGISREIAWPDNTWYAGRAGFGLDVAVLRGTEPSTRWRTFCEEVVGVARELDARLVVTLGALLADVPHTGQVPLMGTAYSDEVIEQFDLARSTYEGPTGIVGVLHHACATAGIPSCSLWAAVPTYVPMAKSPKAALALVQRLMDLLDGQIDTHLLEVAAESYEEQVTQLVEDDEDLADYVRRLEADAESEAGLPTGDDLAAELERFLRDRDTGAG